MIRLTCPAIALLAALTAVPSDAAEVLPGPVTATVLDVIDGDTIVVHARIWLGQGIETRVRLANIDTPELRGRCARETALAEAARAALIAGIADRPVTLSEIRYGTYAGRVVARVSVEGKVDLGQALLIAGLAWAYAGRGPRPDWCGG